MTKFLIGIDEAGRGPLAGPVSVGVVLVPITFDLALLNGVKDSKQLSEVAREEWYEKLPMLEAEHGLRHEVQFSSSTYIDKYGIVPAIRSAMTRALKALNPDPGATEVLLDGSLRAPDIFLNQKTIIKGDQTEPLISLASIAAKVKRDRLMQELSTRYPEYGFEVHKGYGTKKHREALIKHGLCAIHRATFCKLK